MQHQLPFGAQMTDKLFRLAQKPPPPSLAPADCLPSLVWAPQSFAVPGKAGWLLLWIPKSHAESERVFSVDGVSIHISAEVEPLIRDQVFDWDDNKGVVSHGG
jgi:hypothetical protein